MHIDLTGIPIVSIVVFLPLLGALVIAFVPRRFEGAMKAIALGTALLAWAASLVMLVAYSTSAGGFQFLETTPWIPVFGVSYTVAVDGLSIALVVLTTTLTWVSILASFAPIKTRMKEYLVSFLVLEVGMLGVFVALDLFLFYVFWEIVLVPMYLIIGIWGGANRIYATMKFVLYTLVGSLLMLVAILATAFTFQAATGSWDGAFDYLTLRSHGFDTTLQAFAFLAFALAFAIKVPMFPVHTWLPDAHVEAPTAGSVILAGVLLKLGGYGFIRFAVPLYPDAAVTFAPLIIALSVIAIIYGAIVALRQPDLKKLVAYSSVSHMGFVTLGIFTAVLIAAGEGYAANMAGAEQGMQGAILQMVNHGLITGALFLLVGVIYERGHDRTIAKLGGLGGPTPVYAAIFGFFIFASVGLPGLSGFVGEFLVFIGAYSYSPWVAGTAVFVMIFAAAYLLWMAQRLFFGPVSDFLTGLGSHLTDISPVEILTLAPLGALVVVLGLFPGLVLGLVSGSVTDVLASVGGALTAGIIR